MVPALLTRMSTRPSFCLHLMEESLGSGGAGEVGLKGLGTASGGVDGGGGVVGGAAVAVDGYGGSSLRERSGDGRAETAGGSGDEGYFIVETEEIECVWKYLTSLGQCTALNEAEQPRHRSPELLWWFSDFVDE